MLNPVRLSRTHRLGDDQTKGVVKQARRRLALQPPASAAACSERKGAE